MRPLAVTILALAIALPAAPVDSDAQIRRGRDPEPTDRWAPIAVGVRVGLDSRANGEVLGAHLRLPVLRSGVVEIVPNAEMTFLRGAKDYQYGVEGAWAPQGTRGGIFLTGGVAWRETPVGTLGSEGARETYLGGVLGGGVRGTVGRLEVELGLRWVFLDGTRYRPTPATLGISYPFWRTERGGGS